jgi:riboflavin kinase / FMN adenylyltransferase
MSARIFRGLDEIPPDFGPAALTIGNFDGVHAGHRRILRRVVEVARDHGWTPSALTFDPHPSKVVAPSRAPRLMTTPVERVALMESEGIRQVAILPFTREFSHLSPREFAGSIVAGRLGARAVLVGANFRFGYKHAGDTAALAELGREFGFTTEIVPAVRLRGEVVSSSMVRNYLAHGRVLRAARALERPFALEGEVVSGRGIGSTQTVPTLNLATSAELLPARGVYVTRTQDPDDGREWPSVTNIGTRPTFDGHDVTIETFLLGWLTGTTPRRIRVEFLRRLRPERRFDSPGELKTQILKDVRRAQTFLRRVERWCEPVHSAVPAVPR